MASLDEFTRARLELVKAARQGAGPAFALAFVLRGLQRVEGGARHRSAPAITWSTSALRRRSRQ